MGFGILLIGYLFLTNVEVAVNMEHQIGIDVLPDFIGFIIMFNALSRLTLSYSAFGAPKKVIYPLFATSFATLMCQLISIFKIAPALISDILGVLITVQSVILILFHISLFGAAKKLAREIDLTDLARLLKRCLIISAVFYSAHLVLLFIFPIATQTKAIAPFFNFAYYISLLFQYFVLFYNILALYKCYMYIGYEGEETTLDARHPLQRLVDKFKK